MTWTWDAANRRWESGNWWIASQTLPWHVCAILYFHETGAHYGTQWWMFDHGTEEECLVEAKKAAATLDLLLARHGSAILGRIEIAVGFKEAA
jgi:hypothetical protein